MKPNIVVREICSQKPGPTVAIIGGVHGNEPIGVAAINQLFSLKIRR